MHMHTPHELAENMGSVLGKELTWKEATCVLQIDFLAGKILCHRSAYFRTKIRTPVGGALSAVSCKPCLLQLLPLREAAAAHSGLSLRSVYSLSSKFFYCGSSPCVCVCQPCLNMFFDTVQSVNYLFYSVSILFLAWVLQ